LEKNMNDRTQIDYSILDRPEVLQFLFHPRPELAPSAFQATDSANLNPDEKDILIPVEDEVVIGARFHMAEKAAANILFSTAMVRLSPTMMRSARCTIKWAATFWQWIIAGTVAPPVDRPSPP
jgi:hypothetical protein